MLEGLDSPERMQTRDEQEQRAGLVTADRPESAQTTFDAAQPPDRVGPQLQATLNLIPAHTWYANPSGELTFLNERGSDYLGLPKDHPLPLCASIDAVPDRMVFRETKVIRSSF